MTPFGDPWPTTQYATSATGGNIAPPTSKPAGTMTVEQAAKWLGIGRSLAYRMVAEGKIPTIRMGRRILVPVSKLEEMVQA